MISPAPRQLKCPEKRYGLPQILCARKDEISIPKHLEEHDKKEDEETVAEPFALHPFRYILLAGQAESSSYQPKQLPSSTITIAVAFRPFCDGDDQRDEKTEKPQPCE